MFDSYILFFIKFMIANQMRTSLPSDGINKQLQSRDHKQFDSNFMGNAEKRDHKLPSPAAPINHSNSGGASRQSAVHHSQMQN